MTAVDISVEIIDTATPIEFEVTAGIPGSPGVGVPAGGDDGQVLAKASDGDYDTTWVDVEGVSGTVDSVNGHTGVVVLGAADVGADATGAAAAAQAASQPLDSDLTAIAALATASFGRALLTLATAAALRTAGGLGTAATSNTGDFDAAGAAASAQAASQPLDSDLTAIAALATTSFGRAFLVLADAGATRTALGLVIGTDVEAHDADLTTIAGLTPANDDVLQRKAGAWVNRTIAQLATDLGLAASYQPLDSDLTAIAALTTTSYGRALLALADGTALAALISSGTITNAQLATEAQSTIKGRASGAGTGAVTDLTAAQVKTLLAIAVADISDIATSYQPLDSDLTAVAALTTATYGRSLLTLANVAALWAALSGGAGADVSLNSHKLTSVTDPASAQDAATKNYVDTFTPAVGTGLTTTGAVGLDMAALNNTYQAVTLTGDPTFSTSNKAAGRTVTIKLSAGGSSRTLTFPAWIFVGAAAPTTLASGKVGILTVTFFDTTDAAAVASYSAQP